MIGRVGGDRRRAADRQGRGRRRSTRVTSALLDGCRPRRRGRGDGARHRPQPGRARSRPRDRSGALLGSPWDLMAELVDEGSKHVGVPRLPPLLPHGSTATSVPRPSTPCSRPSSTTGLPWPTCNGDQQCPRRPPVRTRVMGRPTAGRWPATRINAPSWSAVSSGCSTACRRGRQPSAGSAVHQGLAARRYHLRRRSGRWPGRQRGAEPGPPGPGTRWRGRGSTIRWRAPCPGGTRRRTTSGCTVTVASDRRLADSARRPSAR